MSDFEDTRDAVTTIGREAGPEAAGLLVALMDQNERHTAGIMASVLQSTEEDRDRWKARALEAERHLTIIEVRVLGLLRVPDPRWDPYDEGP